MVVSIKDKVWHATPPKYVSPGRLHIFHKNQKNTYSGSHYHFPPVLIPITSLTDYTIRTIPTITHLLPHPLHCTDRRSLAHTTCIPFFRAPYILPSFFLHSSYLITHHPLTPLSLSLSSRWYISDTQTSPSTNHNHYRIPPLHHNIHPPPMHQTHPASTS